MNGDPLLGIWKYSQYLLCLFDIGLTNNYYFENFLNCLIIEFLKIGRNCEGFRTLPREELEKELQKIEREFQKVYYE